MKSTDDVRVIDDSNLLNGARARRILVQRPMGSDFVVITAHGIAGSGAGAPRPRQ